MDKLQNVLARLGEKPVHFADMLEPLRRGSADVLYDGPDGVLMFEREGGVHMMTAQTPEGAEACFQKIQQCELLVGHELWYQEQAAERFDLSEAQLCWQAVWTNPAPPPEPKTQLKLLDSALAPWVYEHYSHPFGGVEYMEGAIQRGMLGAYLDGELAGFVGFHDEGSIGMLEVLPQFQRRGVGLDLLHGAVRLALQQGAIPFGQVFTNNTASLALQKKAGLAVSDDVLFWLM